MATILSQAAHPSSPSPPSTAAIARRGRRPALIPHNADLRLSLSAASAALGMATYSPGREKGLPGVWVLPPPSSGLPRPTDEDWEMDFEDGELIFNNPKKGLFQEHWPKDDDSSRDRDGDDMEIDGIKREQVERDVFSWVNSTDNDHPFSHPPKQLRHHNPPNQSLDSSSVPSLTSSMSSISGIETVPTSPCSGGFPEQLELQRRRLEAAERAGIANR
ncbi:hypothetical protein RUND412_002678 [Rhizina undulata]